MFRKLSLSSFTLLIFAVLSLTGCGGGSGNTGDKAGLTAPTVSAKSPVGSSVSINAVITATFSAPMNSSSITTSSFTLKDSANNNIAGTISYAGNTATFTPSANLASLTTYTVTISTAVQDVNGLPLVSPDTWTFSTPVAPDTTPPVVLPATLSPAINTTGVAANSTISATFSKLLNTTTFDPATTFTLSNGSSPITGTVSSSTTTVLGAQVTTATFIPSSSLTSGKTYTATITSGVKDLVGNALAANYTWSFTTEFTFNKTISSNVANYNLYNDAIANGWDGTSVLNATVTVSPGVYVYSTNTANAGFDTGVLTAGSKVTIINNGYIVGMGGAGGSAANGLAGGPAMSLSSPVSIDTSVGYLLGGGGGGGAAVGLGSMGGGGGAGGGSGGAGSSGANTGAAGSSVQSVGIVGGGAGGNNGTVFGGAGGAFGATGQTAYGGIVTYYTGGAAGAAIALNGNTVTWVNAHTNVYGAVQ